MWICLNNAFLSIVADKTDPSRLMVRSRRKCHLTNVFGKRCKIQTDVGTDYKYRTFVDRKLVASLIAAQLEGIGYTNFKDSVRDATLHNLYLRFWYDHAAMQR